MKTGKFIRVAASFALVFAALISLNSCKKKTVTPDVSAMLKSGTWKINTVTVDGTDNLSLFSGMTLTFSTTSFSTTNGGPVWPASGTWTINSAGTVITRGDGLTVNIDKITSTSLTLSIIWNKTTLSGGRSVSIAGNHVFTFAK